MLILGLKVKFGNLVCYLFGPLVINSAIQFSVFLALQIQPNGPVRRENPETSFLTLLAIAWATDL